MNRRPHDRWDTGEGLAGWGADDAPAYDWLDYLLASLVAACIIGGVYALGQLVVSSAREKAPPVSEAGGAPLSSTEPTKGTAS